MSKQYLLRFGNSNPNAFVGLNPTFTSFVSLLAGTSALPPGITGVPGGTGLYYFTYGATVATSFIVDGATTGLSDSQRYISGLLDPIDAVDQQLSALGATMQSIGSTLSGLIGTTASSFGSTSVDPSTLYGYLKRLQELQEGDASFNKSSGEWDIASRGASTLLRVKTLTNSSTLVQKS